jgi:hypothetical protein
MPRLIQDWLLPLLAILSNGFLGWLINQLPSKQDLHIPDPVIFWLTGGCIVALFIFGLLSSQSQPNAAPPTQNQNWVVGFLPLLGGTLLYGLSNYVPAAFSPAVFYASLALVVLGILLPPVLLLPKKWQRRLVWFLPGAGLAITVHFLLNRQWIAAVLWLFLTGILGLLTLGGKFFKQVIHRLSPRFEAWLEQLAISLADSLWGKLEEVTSPFQREYYQNLVYTCRDYQTQGLDKDRILKLEKVFVPLKIVLKEAVQADANMIPQVKDEAKNPKEKQIWDFLAAMRNDPAFRRMAVLGAPGSGKTTLLRYLTLTYATKQERKLHPNAPKLIPVLFYLKDVRQVITSQQPPSLAELITEQVKQERKIQPLNPPSNWFAEKLRQNKCLVMLDGLDEVADETQRQQVSRWVDEQMQAYPDTPFILTSRPFGYKSGRLQQEVTVLEVQPFSLKQMEQFIHNWYLQTEVMSRAGEEDLGVREDAKQQADDLIKRIKKSPPLAAMAVNPLLLTMIATVHRRGSALPGKRVELYKEICHVLLEKRQRAKKIADPLPLTATQKQSVLQVLALALMQQNTREFTLAVGVSVIQDKLEMVAGSTANPEEFLKQIRDVSGLLVEKELGVYEFAHLSFQEYLAAVQVKESNQENLLIQHINNSWWAETIRLYAAQSNSSNVIRAVLGLPSPSIETLALAYDCLEEGLSIDSEVRKQLEEQLDADLESR